MAAAAGLLRRVGALGEAEAFFQFGDEAGVDLPQHAADPGRQVAPLGANLAEVPREKEVHQVPREDVDGFLRGQVGAVEVVDAAVGLVGGQQAGLYIVERHAEEMRTVAACASRVKTDFWDFTGPGA